MTENQTEMLRKAKLEWLDQALQNQQVEHWVLEALSHDGLESHRLLQAFLWLEVNGYVIYEKNDTNEVVLIKDGEVLSRFMWDVK